jgi:small-conductance mechanosensitive channel
MSRSAFALVILLLSLARWVAAGQEPAKADVEDEVPTAPVELDGREMFRVRGVSSYPAPDRARLIGDKVAAVAADRMIAVESLHTVERDGVTRIQAGETPLMRIVDADAEVEQVHRADLAQAHLHRIREAITAYRSERSVKARAVATALAAGATFLLAVAVAAIFRAWRLADRALARRIDTHSRPAVIPPLQLIQTDRIWTAARAALGAARSGGLIASVLVYLGFVLARFPETRGLAQSLVGFVMAPLRLIGSAAVRSIPNVAFLLVLFFVFRLLLALTRVFFEAIQRRAVTFSAFDPDWAQPTYRVVRIALIAFALVVAFPYIPGSDSAAFQGVSIFLGVLFSLGSSSAIANIIAGYMLIYRRAFKIGDRIRIGDCMGDVIEMRLQVTHLRTPKNEEMIIPNSKILSTDVMNYSSLARAHGLILHTEVGVGYDISWRNVETMLLAAAARTPGLRTQPSPFILEKRLTQFNVVYELNVYTTNAKAMGRTYAALHRNILDVFNEHGVQIMTPAYENDPVAPKIVPPNKRLAATATAQKPRRAEG